MWEHAFYIDYKNEKAKYVDNFWKVVNWDAAERRYENITLGLEKGGRVRKAVPDVVSTQVPTR